LPGLLSHIRFAVLAFVVACALPASGFAAADTGGTSPEDPQFKAPGNAQLLSNGQALPPSDAPPEVVAAIDAANRIATLPYRYGGGHAKVEDTAYDCSGSVSYALIAAGLLKSPLPSGDLTKWGEAGPGKWITVYAHGGHTYAVIAGLRFDTSMRTVISRRRAATSKRRSRRVVIVSSRWSKQMRPTSGYTVRHALGF
jgi:hypothetical protein